MTTKLLFAAGIAVAALAGIGYCLSQAKADAPEPVADAAPDTVVMTVMPDCVIDQLAQHHLTVDAARLYPEHRIEALRRAMEDYVCMGLEETLEESDAKHKTMLLAYAALTTP